MKKKLLAALLCGTMAGGIFTGCASTGTSNIASSSTADSTSAAETTVVDAAEEAESSPASTESGSDSDEQITLSVFWWGSQIRNERTQEILDMYTEKHPNITFDGQFSDDYWTRVATLAAGHNMPDVVQFVYAFLPQYSQEGTLLDLSKYIDDGTIDLSNVADSVVETGRVGDGIYGVCNGINASALFYNKTLLDDNGINIHDYMTVSEFEDLCQEVYEKTGYKTSLSYGGMTSETYMQLLLRAEGKHLYNGSELGISDPEEIRPFFQMYEDGLKAGWLIDPSLYVERTRGQVQEDTMVYGDSPESLSWCGFYSSNQLVAMQAAAPEGTDIAITTFPVDDSSALWLNPSQFFSVSADTKYPEEAAKLIDYITNDIDCNNVLLGERGVPISSVVAEAIADKQTDDDKEITSYLNNVVTPVATTIDPASPAGATEMLSIIDSLTEKVMYGELTAEDASTQFIEQATKAFAEVNK